MPLEVVRGAGETAVIVPNASAHEVASDPALIKAIARGVTWFEELATGRIDTVRAIGERDGL
jgi:hypothetical protein